MLMGSSPGEIRQKLGLTPVPVNHLESVSLIAGGRETRLSAGDLIRGGCGPYGGSLNVEGPATTDAFGFKFSFSNDRLISVSGDIRHPAISDQDRLFVTCHTGSYGNPGYDPGDPMEEAAFAVIFSPVLAIGAAQQTPTYIRHAAANARLAPFRLGQQPPGGFEAYAAKLPPGVSVAGNSSKAVITVEFPQADFGFAYGKVDVILTGGRVTGFEKQSNFVGLCVLRADDSLQC
ncbi:MAG: hypothetical protein JWM33_779 [Caulobacteraceae bacterium]|nr:hypothetical protein [Caulobacteraceae bacterium]